MRIRDNRLAAVIFRFVAATIFGVTGIFVAPQAHGDDGTHSSPAPAAAPAHATPPEATRPPEAPPAPRPAAPAVARPAEPSAAPAVPAAPQNTPAQPAQPTNPAVNVRHDDHHDDDRIREHRAERNRNNYYPLGYPFVYFDPAWNGYGVFDDGNQSAYQLLPDEQPDQQNADFAPPYDQSANTPTPQAAAPAPPGGGSPALDSALIASPQWRDANAQLQVAQSEYDTARARVVAQLRNQPAFQQALATKQQDAQRVAALKARDPDATISNATTVATAKLDAAKQVTDMEAAALAADPQASAAKAKLDAAIAQRNEARQAVIASLPKPASPAPR